jgi:hypothetical protein
LVRVWKNAKVLDVDPHLIELAEVVATSNFPAWMVFLDSRKIFHQVCLARRR